MVRAAIIGYGATHSQGKHHVEMIQQIKGIECVAICDIDAKRREIAHDDYPGLHIAPGVDALLDFGEFDLLVVVLPHYLHAEIACIALRHGKHVIVEKPMCITVTEADKMIETAQKYGKMLSVYHNRRWDANFCTLKRIVNEGRIGDLFHIDLFHHQHKKDLHGWRSNRYKSGGFIYDWGSHLIDWLLILVNKKIDTTIGFNYKEKHAHVIIKFEDGCVGDVQVSRLTTLLHPLWQVYGTQGSIYSTNTGFETLSFVEGFNRSEKIPYTSDNVRSYYENIVAYLAGEIDSLDVTSEEAKQVVAIMETVCNDYCSNMAK